jgi:glycosyltransferase involved in cell wall biosynthesis
MISVWITCYNQANYLYETINSVLNQTLLPHEILISDDCSTDNSRKILEYFSNEYPDLIKVYYQPARLGITKNKNFILSKTNYDYVTWLDGDDLFHPRKIEWEMKTLNKFPNIKIIFSDVDKIDNNGDFLGPMYRSYLLDEYTKVKSHTNMKPHVVDLTEHILNINDPVSYHRNELIHRSVIDKIGLYDENIVLWQDYDYRIRIHKYFNAVYLPCTLQDYRISNNQASNSDNSKNKKDLEYLYEKHTINSTKYKQDWKDRING